jgi:hypothetical protein
MISGKILGVHHFTNSRDIIDYCSLEVYEDVNVVAK